MLWGWTSPALLPTQKDFRAGQSIDAVPALPRQLHTSWVLEDACAAVTKALQLGHGDEGDLDEEGLACEGPQRVSSIKGEVGWGRKREK